MAPSLAHTSSVRNCDGCGAEIVYRGRGRPRRWCETCGAKQRAYYEANKDDIAAKKRAYYEANKERRAPHCAVCDDRLLAETPDGLCGFCREELTGTPFTEVRDAA